MVTLFVAELTDKDALLILALATRTRPLRIFLAGASAFFITTALFVSLGSLAAVVVPILWIKLAGGSVMIAYGLWEARGLIGRKVIEEDEGVIEKARGGVRAFLLTVGALATLDMAGDATEVLTIVFVAQYSNFLLVFTATYLGLVGATAVETALGNRLGKILSPRRVRFVSMTVFLLLGASIITLSLV